MERICKSPHDYAGRQRTVGERFDVEAGHVEVLTLLGHIEDDIVAAQSDGKQAAARAAAPQQYATRAMTAQPEKRGNHRKAA